MAGPGFLHRFGPLPTHQAGPHSPSSPLPPLSFSPTSSTPQSSGSLALTSSSPQTVFLTSPPSASLSSSSSAPSLSSSPSSVSASSLSAAPSSSLSSSPLPMFSSTSTSSLSGLAGVRGEGQSSGPSDHGASHFFGMLASAKASAASPGREPIREKKRVQVKHACVNCQVAKTACSSFRPCQYCIDRQIESTCTVAVRKPRRPAKIPRLAVPGTNQFCQMPMTFSKPPLSPHNKQGMLPPASSTSASASNPSISSLSISSLAAASSAVTSDPLDSASASWQQRMFTFGQPTMLGADVAKTTNAASSSSTAARLPASGFATASRFAGDSSTSTSSSSTAPGPSMEQRRWRKRSTSSGGDFLVDFSKSLTHLAENSERASTGTFEPTASMSDSSLSALDSYASAHMLSPRGSSAPGASGFLGSPYHNFSSPNATPSALLPSFSPSSGYLPPLAELFSTKIRSEDSSLGSTSSSSLSSPSPSLSSLASSPMSSMLSASSSSLSTHASSPSLATAASTALNAATPTQPHTHHRLQQSQQQQRADTPPQPEEQKNDVEWFFYTTHADHPVSISMWNLTSGDILQSNQEFLNLVGRTYEELVLGFSLRHLFSPEAFVEIQMAIKAPQITSIPLPIDLSSFPLTISSKASEHISSFLYKITMPEEWQRDDPNVARVIGILMQFPLGKTAKHKDQTA